MVDASVMFSFAVLFARLSCVELKSPIIYSSIFTNSGTVSDKQNMKVSG